MDKSKYSWYKIAESFQELVFGNNRLIVTTVNKKKITIAEHAGKLYACGYTCPHAGGILADGHVDALGNIVCPLHHYRFSIQNGRNTSGEGYYLTHWPIETREDGIYVGMESGTGLFGWFK